MLPSEVSHFHYGDHKPEEPTVDLKVTQGAKGEIRWEIEVNNAPTPEDAARLFAETGLKLDEEIAKIAKRVSTE